MIIADQLREGIVAGTFSSGDHDRGTLVGATIVGDGEELLLIRASGKVIRSHVDEVRATGRTTMGVQFAEKSTTDLVISIARNVERDVDVEVVEGGAPDAAAGDAEGVEVDAAIVDATDAAAPEADEADDVTATDAIEETDE